MGDSNETRNEHGEMIVQMEQRILQLQGKLSQARNLSNLPFVLNAPLEPQVEGNIVVKSNATFTSHPLPPFPIPQPPNNSSHIYTLPKHNSYPHSCPPQCHSYPTPLNYQTTSYAHNTPPTFTTNIPHPNNHTLDPSYVKTTPFTHHKYKSKPPANVALMQSVVERLKQFEGNKGLNGLSYEDLSIYPDVELPEGCIIKFGS